MTGTYGRSFADVYDQWYPADERTDTAVAAVVALAALRGHGASVLELGVGTGRLALPLAAAGLAVTGLDSSQEMLERLAAKDTGNTVVGQLADVGAPDGGTPGDPDAPPAWPDGPFDVVLAACNLLCNLTDARRQAACVSGAAARLRPGGHLVVEAFEPAPLVTGPQLSASEVRGDAVVLIATDADPSTGVVVGQHIELHDGEPVRLRPWSIRVASPEEIDAWAAAAGLELVSRSERWNDGTDRMDAASDGLVSIYRRP